MTAINIYQASKDELDWINAKYGEVGFLPSNFEEEFIVIAEFEGQKAGLGRLTAIDKNNIELGGIYVFEDFRGKGIAADIVSYLCEKSPYAGRGIWCIPFAPLEDFYQKFGFKRNTELVVPEKIAKKVQWCGDRYDESILILAKAATSLFTPFQQSTSGRELPERFTFPFYYEPHPIALLAAEELQQYIETQTEWDYDFGLEEEKPDLMIGKMFGVLVVKNKNGELGYLSAFSGKLAGSNHLSKFVPPVFDMLTDGSFLNQGMDELNTINIRVKELEEQSVLLDLIKLIKKEKEKAAEEIAAQKTEMKRTKLNRNQRRNRGKETLDNESFFYLEKVLGDESIAGKIKLKMISKHWEGLIAKEQEKLDAFNGEINDLKNKRKNLSAFLQRKLFEQYTFLNKDGEEKSLLAIFDDSVPMGGSGECAAPKLLQYAFSNNMKPIALAEFWWGQSPKSEIRKHKHFFPACQGKCKPILGHMLKGILMDENPLLENPAEGKTIDIVYEDEFIAIINKPAEFLSVPGRYIKDSVATRMKEKYPEATGPLIAHRLDMSTSGLMLIAKSLAAHKRIQGQFIKRTIKKRYVAILDGLLPNDEGLIDLPLRTDWDNRPMQMVCYEDGKTAQTRYKVMERKEGKTRVQLFPVTGRTHQLRVHAAHPKGLNMPILGDDLYGQRGERLLLHAEWIGFRHPGTGDWVEYEVGAGF
ncbi:MAG: tRNA pseudouridine32 synthase/23S rRNA pseudouridine746 synthase [Gammaproteobacteria bacterium]|jgi:tRNA pseudouridine32 synthase/23S rRNA pseudouridine746 synthase